MPAYYTVIQYVPDPIADERVNFGILVWNDHVVRAQFVRDWRRVRAFGQQETQYLREFSDRVKGLASQQMTIPLGAEITFDSAYIEKTIGRWKNSIQFTGKRASLKSPDQLLKEIAPTFLKDEPVVRRRSRGRRSAASIAKGFLFEALSNEVQRSTAIELLKMNEEIEGKLDSHNFDLVLANGKTYCGVQALSFEVLGDSLRREIDATAWALDDVKKADKHLQLGVFVIPPAKSEMKAEFAHASKLFKNLGADVLTESAMPGWAKKRAKLVVAKAAHRAN
jgi:hypothetical protein